MDLLTLGDMRCYHTKVGLATEGDAEGMWRRFERM